MSTVLHKDGEQFAIVTSAESEEEFRLQFALALQDMITSGKYEGEWAYHLNGWMEPATEVSCKYRGYKSSVIERRTLIAGVLDPDAAVMTIEPKDALKA